MPFVCHLLGDAAARYLDALHVATEDRTGSRALAEIEATAKHLAPGLTDEPAWPTLRTSLVTAAAAGEDPLDQLIAAAVAAPLGTAQDTAAVLTWRLDNNASTRREADEPGPRAWTPFKNAHSYYDTNLIADLDIWRATTGVSSHDPTPTGPPQSAAGLATWQQHLNDLCRAADVTLQYEARLAENRTQIRLTKSRPRSSSITPRKPRRGRDR